MAELYNIKSQRVEVVPDEEVLERVKGGGYGLPKALVRDGHVNVNTPQGPISVPVQEVTNALERGYTLETGWQHKQRRDIGEHEERQQMLERVEPVVAGLSGAASTFTLGLSDALTSVGEAAGVVPAGSTQNVAALREANPTATAIGSVAGALTPGGGASLAARAGKGAVNLLRGGKLATQAAQTAGLGQRVLQSAANVGISGATEGAIYGAAQGVSEYSLGTADNLAESVISNAGMGALFGGGFGAGLGAAGTVTNAALRSAGRTIRSALPKGLQGRLDDIAEEAALRSTGATGAQIRKLDDSFGQQIDDSRIKQIVSRLKETPHPTDGGAIIRAGATVDDVAARLKTTVDDVGERLGGIYQQADDVVAQQGMAGYFNRQRIIDRIQNEIVAPARGQGGSKAVARAAKRVTDGWLEKADDFGIKELHDEYRGLRKAFSKAADPGSALEAQQQIGRILRDELEGAMKQLEGSGALRAGLADEYMKLRDTYSDLRELSDAADKMRKQRMGNNFLPLTSYIVGGTASAGAVAAEIASGDADLQGLATAAGTGLALGYASKVAKQRLASLAYKLADNLSTTGFLQTAQRGLDQSIDATIKSFQTPPVRSAVAPVATKVLLETSFAPQRREKSRNSQDAAKQRGQELSELVANPDKMTDLIAQNVAVLERHAPETAAVVAQKMAQTVQFLHSKAPKPPVVRSQPLTDKWRPTAEEASKFARYVAAAENPTRVLESIQRRIVTDEEIETLETLYPEMLNKLRHKLSVAVNEPGVELGYEDVIELSLVLGQPLDETLDPAFLAAQQSVFSTDPTDGQGAGGLRLTGLDDLAISEQMRTPSQKREIGA